MATHAMRNAANDIVDWAPIDIDIVSPRMPAALTTDHHQPRPAKISRTAGNHTSVRDRLAVGSGNAGGYHRRLTLTPTGVIAEETSDDTALTDTIRAHAREVTGFVRDGMPAMMQGMRAAE